MFSLFMTLHTPGWLSESDGVLGIKMGLASYTTSTLPLLLSLYFQYFFKTTYLWNIQIIFTKVFLCFYFKPLIKHHLSFSALLKLVFSKCFQFFHDLISKSLRGQSVANCQGTITINISGITSFCSLITQFFVFSLNFQT